MVKISCFEMLGFVEAFGHDILVSTVQKYLVGYNRHHLTVNSSMYNKVFVIYFYFVGKMGNYHSDLVRDVDSHGCLLTLLM